MPPKETIRAVACVDEGLFIEARDSFDITAFKGTLFSVLKHEIRFTLLLCIATINGASH